MRKEPRKPQNTRLYIAIGFLLLLSVVVFAQQAFDLKFIPHSSLTPNQILLLYALSTLIFVVLLVFGFILLRSLVKVWVERKLGKPGSRFKVSLLAMLGVLTLVPAVSVFAFAYGLTNRSIDKWLSAPVDEIFKTNEKIEGVVAKQQQENAQSILNYLAANVPSDFAQTRRTFQLKALILIHEDGTVEASSLEPGIDSNTLTREVFASLSKNSEGFSSLKGDWLAT